MEAAAELPEGKDARARGKKKKKAYHSTAIMEPMELEVDDDLPMRMSVSWWCLGVVVALGAILVATFALAVVVLSVLQPSMWDPLWESLNVQSDLQPEASSSPEPTSLHTSKATPQGLASQRVDVPSSLPSIDRSYPGPPLNSMAAIPRTGAELSSSYDSSLYIASQVIDGNPATICVSGEDRDTWLSVSLEFEADVEFVTVYNRQDQFASWLSPFEIWVGAAPFRNAGISASTRCGDVNVVPTGPGPFTIRCGGVRGAFVTLRLTEGGGAARIRYLSIGELEVYSLLAAAVWPPLAPPGPLLAASPPTQLSSPSPLCSPPPRIVVPGSPMLPPPPQPLPPAPHPPPPPPYQAPALSQLVTVSPVGAVMSSTSLPASNCVDGDQRTHCTSRAGIGNWLSVQFTHNGMRSGIYVAIEPYKLPSSQLSPFELYRGAAHGDTLSQFASRCSGDEPVTIPESGGPHVVNCVGGSGAFVTLKQIGRSRILSLTDISLYVDPAPLMPPLPPPPPVPPGLPPDVPSPPDPPWPPQHPPMQALGEWRPGYTTQSEPPHC